jgi:queuine tRNA-ribosyltransferase
VTATATVVVDARDGRARATTITTPRGAIRTPCFMPVGTRGSVRAVDADDLGPLGAQVVLGNTYHLMLKPGAEVVAELGGLHRFTGWDGHMLTDSGGFQVFSLGPKPQHPGRQHAGGAKLDEDGVTFRSTYDGSTHRLTPESAVAVQELLGADIQMQLDICPPLPSPERAVRLAVERTLAWGERALAARRREGQLLFGIVQGGIDVSLRAEAAARTVALRADGAGFDGFGIGGLSVGEQREEMVPAIAAAVGELPEDRPRYVMGLGDPAGMVEAVAQGVDLFDCVLPTRLGRHGTVLTSAGRLNIRNARWARDDGPLDPSCACRVCSTWSRGYLRHLHVVGEPSAQRLTTLHNLAWTLDLVARMRASIEAGTFDDLRRGVLSAWG